MRGTNYAQRSFLTVRLWPLAHVRRQVFPAFIWGEWSLLILAVRGVRGGVGTALVVLQRQVAVRVAVPIYTQTERRG